MKNGSRGRIDYKPIDIELRSEERLARLVRLRASSIVPIELERLAAEYADVIIDDIPIQCDGLLYFPEHRRRPLIILQRMSNAERRRFTLAHELGHLLIPWHIGERIHTHRQSLEYVSEYNDPYRRQEAEANRFASELLMPSDWLAEKMGSLSFAALLDQTSRCLVSYDVQAYAMGRLLPTDAFVALCGATGRIIRTASSRMDKLTIPETNSSIVEYVQVNACSYECVNVRHDRSMYIVQYDLSSLRRPVLSGRPSEQILRAMVADIDDTLSFPVVQKSMAGVVGAAWAKWRMAPHEEFVACLVDFCARHQVLRPLAAHPAFLDYVWTRVGELASRR
ncbi:MAG: ImmA/IrrE family metallo-endopeptidase [Phycisphaeraceae bacterium]|nr:MAG: ImmA/IrrE family metallo-endopeptidase [Phycisphaeraceae bacterium]